MSQAITTSFPAVVTPALTDAFPVVQSGVDKKETLQQVLTLFNSNIQLAAPSQITGRPTDVSTITATTTLTNPLNSYYRVDMASPGQIITIAAANGATAPAKGEAFVFYNAGSNTYTLKDNAGNTLASTISQGVYIIVRILDNTTVAGTQAIQVIGTMAAQNYNNVGISGGSIDGTDIGNSTPATVTAASLYLYTGSTLVQFLTNATSTPRQYTFQDRTGTIADNTDIATCLKIANNLSDVASLSTTQTNLQITGTQTLSIRASGWDPAQTNGATLFAVPQSANGNNALTYAFDPTTAEYVHFHWQAPKRWNLGTVTFQVYVVANATSGSAVFGLQGVARSAGDAFNVAFGTAQTVTVTASGTAYNTLVSSASSAITIAGTPAAGDDIEFRLYRDASAGGDDLSVDACLVGVKIFWTSNAGNDA